MKFLKYLGLTILAIIVIALIVAIFVPKEKTFSSTIQINKPKQEVYEYVRFLKNQEKFSYFILESPSIQLNYEGTDGEVGAKSTWTSKEMGDGNQTISRFVNQDSVITALDFGMGGDPAISTFALSEINPTQTQVYYGVHMKSFYPFNITFLIFNMDHAFVTSLNNLKKVMEQ